jgi:hypothetical protein
MDPDFLNISLPLVLGMIVVACAQIMTTAIPCLPFGAEAIEDIQNV